MRLLILLLLLSGCSSIKDNAIELAEKNNIKIVDNGSTLKVILLNKNERWEFNKRDVIEFQNNDYRNVIFAIDSGIIITTHRDIICSECNGTGKVSYENGHFFVENGLAEANKEYTCSICSGSKMLIEEIRRMKNVER